LEPPTIEAIRFRASWHLLDVTGIDQSDLKAAGFEHLKQGNPVHAIIGTGQGLHWPDVDEDISAIGMLTGTPAPPPKQKVSQQQV